GSSTASRAIRRRRDIIGSSAFLVVTLFSCAATFTVFANVATPDGRGSLVKRWFGLMAELDHGGHRPHATLAPAFPGQLTPMTCPSRRDSTDPVGPPFLYPPFPAACPLRFAMVP